MKETNLSANQPRDARLTAYISYAMALLVAVAVTIIRLRALNTPLERDEGEYAYAGMMMLKGYWPYEDFYNMKLPGTYLLYSFFMLVFGQSIWAIHCGALLLNLLSAGLMFLLGRQLAGPLAGAVAAAILLIICISPELQGTSANAEHFVLPFIIGGWLLVTRMKGLLWAGILLSIGVTMKQHGVVFVFAAGVYVLIVGLRSAGHWRQRIHPALLLTAGACIPALALIAVFLLRGTFSDMVFYTISYAGHYATMHQGSIIQKILDSPTLIWRAQPLWLLLALVGLVAAVFSHRHALSVSVLILLSSAVAISIGLYYRPHYFILGAPAIALLGGLALAAIPRFRTRVSLAWISIVLLCSLSVESFYRHRAYYFAQSPFVMSRTLYGASAFPETVEIGHWIRDHSRRDAQVAVLGNEPQICFHANRSSPTGFMYVYPIWEDHPYNNRMLAQFKAEVSGGEPEFIIYCRIAIPHPPNPRMQFLRDFYVDLRDALYTRVGFVSLTGLTPNPVTWTSDTALVADSNLDWIEICRKRQ